MALVWLFLTREHGLGSASVKENNFFLLRDCVVKGDFCAAFSFCGRNSIVVIEKAILAVLDHFKISFHIDCSAGL